MLKKFVQGKPGCTLIESFLESNLAYLQDLEKTCSEEEVARYRNCFTFVKMREVFLKEKFSSVQLRLAEPHYYELSLDQRAQFLKTEKEYLCKTMVMENTSYNAEYEG